MSRYFISITLPQAIQESVDQILPDEPQWRKVKREQLHLTLRFIGEAESSRIDQIQESLKEIDLPAFNLKLKGVGFFPDDGPVRVIWLGIENKSALMDLQQKVDEIVSDVMNSDREHSFVPHVTLARIKKGFLKSEKLLDSIPEENEQFEFKVRSFQLMESKKGSRGVDHHIVENYELKSGERNQ
ncbi:RNA 2',3'-cyclic phosphodiesterase [Rhodohalobacter barkolensis]|uniref:RNA 2',3'-cyclic phosphodiesterase n=1 Tax=Rhodohalobacter barkolensis TaxID=2053187 RepID=A0A2N0VG41_9BACT|nr:RNA 2',3'-cyclic phosphodiesterase [Rhodohalobacter barkolensis]PKD43151.1 RNA 2',3'-cyclic phosphodiesterase [Rhodohalobacter barkolensis]